MNDQLLDFLSGGGGMEIGGDVDGGVDHSVLFVHPAGILAQGSLFWDESILTLTVGTIPFLDYGNNTWGIGTLVLDGADPVSNVIALGTSTATGIQSGASGMVAIGASAGYEAFQAGNALLFGALAGFQAANAPNLVALGNGAGRGATNAGSAIMGGGECGRGAADAARVLWWGSRAGYLDAVHIDPDSEDFSILYGGYASTGGYKNSIGIGQGVQNSAEQQFNLGNVLFGLNIYTGTTPDPTPVSNPLVGIGIALPLAPLHLVGIGPGYGQLVAENGVLPFQLGVGIASFDDDIIPGTLAGDATWWSFDPSTFPVVSTRGLCISAGAFAVHMRVSPDGTVHVVETPAYGTGDLVVGHDLWLEHSLARYAAVPTTGWGVPAIYASDRKTAQVAAASLAAYTVGAADGSFEVSANINVTASTAFSFGATVSYTDETNTPRTAALPFVNLAGTVLTTITNVLGAGPYEGVPLHLRCKAATAITIATVGTFTTVTYNVDECIRQLA